MTEKINRLTLLIMKHLKDELLPDEKQELQQWIYVSEENQLLFNQLTDPDTLQAEMQEFHEARTNIKDKIDLQLAEINKSAETKVVSLPAFSEHRSNRRAWIYAAASIFLLLSAGSYWWVHRSPTSAPLPTPPTVSSFKNDIPPGGNTAILTLGNGSTLLLNDTKIGAITQQGNSQLTKLTNGQIAYKRLNNTSTETLYNTISTPRGGQYQVTLPDGSKVWLNAASSLRFPTSFSGPQRTVDVTGEAYFEIARNKAQPFIVKTGDLSVAVMGTSFNIMSYQEEKSIRTTLLSGSVRVNRNTESILLTPGQQAQVTAGQLRIQPSIDMEEVVAWKDGLFKFNSADIETVMRSIARWYSVDIKYQGPKAANRLTALIKRDSYVSDVLQILETSGYHFKIEGKTITVLP